MFKKSETASFFTITAFFMCISIADAGIWVEPNNFDVNINEGCVQGDILTIGNDGTQDVNFLLRSREISREFPGGLSSKSTVVSQAKTTSNSIVLEYSFGSPVAGRSEGYDTVQVKGLKTYERTGAPIVPLYPATILVPYGREVVNTRVVCLNKTELPGTYQLPPAQKPYPLSFTGIKEQTRPDPAIYGKKAPWPGKDRETIGTYSKRGYQMLFLNLFPVQYEPASGRITYTTRIKVEIELGDCAEKSIPKPTGHIVSVIKRRVDNPEVLESYPEQETPAGALGAEALPGGGPYQYVIITSQALQSAPGPYNFQALRDAKISRGVSATIVTTEWIYANYDGSKPSGGSDNQTKIRNFLIDAYHNGWGTQYVLLGGTNAIVPARMFWVDSLADATDYMPVDMYYGCVDPPACTFDYDADNKYGEPTDGPDGGEVDLAAEIYVGRAAVENTTEVANFVRKTLEYNSTRGEYLSRIAMVGEYLGFGGPMEYAADSMEQIRTGGTFDGYFTRGFENHNRPGFYDFDTSTNLYDAPNYNWPKNELINLMNQGVHIINHLGHANYTYDMKLYTSDLSSLANTDYFFVYSQGCDAGGFDVTNCFAEAMTSVEHGAYAAIMNARFGWGTENSTDGPSQRFARQFWDAPLGEGIIEIGRANQDSKEDNIWGLAEPCIRWCYYELNLFGDPQQAFRFDKVCRWIILEPNEGTIGPGSSADIDVTFDALNLPPGQYGAEILVGSGDPCGPLIVPADLTVNADALQVSPVGGFDSNGSEGGPFVPASKKYTLTNISGSTINWIATKTWDWLTITPSAGALGPDSSTDVNVCIDANANLLDPNLYTDTVTFQNTDSGSIRWRDVSLAIRQPDKFTETYANGSALYRLSLTLRPNNSLAGYEACRDETSEFPSDPNGGTYLPLGDDDFAEVILNEGKEALFYGQSYDRFYVGSNGYITFGGGDTGYEDSLENHFGLPRISGCFTDLTPANTHSISVKQFVDRAAITFLNVPVFGDKTSKNSFQMELFFTDGTIRLTWLEVAEAEGVAGLSKGEGFTDEFFEESDFDGYPVCWPRGDYNRDYVVSVDDLSIFAAHWLNDDCGFPAWCDWTDLDYSSMVEGVDFSVFASNWRVEKSTMPPPIAWWKFDEGAGTTAYDSAGNNDGELTNGPVWTTGNLEGALDFDGVDDYVEVGDTVKNALGTDYTVSAWIKTETFSSNYVIAAYRSQTGEGQPPLLFQLDQVETSVRFIVADNYQHILAATYSNVLMAGDWYHVAGIRSGNTLNIYVNGASGTPASGTLTGAIDSDNLKIGAAQCGGSADYFFNGVIDEVRIYNRALTTGEIEQLYQSGL